MEGVPITILCRATLECIFSCGNKDYKKNNKNMKGWLPFSFHHCRQKDNKVTIWLQIIICEKGLERVSRQALFYELSLLKPFGLQGNLIALSLQGTCENNCHLSCHNVNFFKPRIILNG